MEGLWETDGVMRILLSRADTLQWHWDQTAPFCTHIWQAAMVAADANLLA